MLFLSIALVACVLIGTVGRYQTKALATKHVHKWWTEGMTTIKVFDPAQDGQPNQRPVRRDTHFSQSCETCGDKKVKIVTGQWTNMDGTRS